MHPQETLPAVQAARAIRIPQMQVTASPSIGVAVQITLHWAPSIPPPSVEAVLANLTALYQQICLSGYMADVWPVRGLQLWTASGSMGLQACNNRSRNLLVALVVPRGLAQPHTPDCDCNGRSQPRPQPACCVD